MGDVVDLGNITTLDLDPDRLLQKAVGELTEVVIVGFDKEGKEYFASSKADAGEVIYHLERCKYRLMQMVDDLQA